MKIKVILSLLIICSIASAQNKPQFLLGGSLGYRYADDYSSLTDPNFIQSQEHLILLNPVAGYFITDWFVAGIGFEYLYNYTEFDNYVYYYSKETGFSIAPFIRTYTPFGLFIQAEISYGNSKINFDGRPIPGPTGFSYTSINYSYNKVLGYSVGIGYNIKLNEYVGIEPAVKYLGVRFKEKDQDNNFNRRGILFNIGLVCFIK